MANVRELPLEGERRFRRTAVQARNGKWYTVLSFRLYDREPPPEFPNFEVNVIESDETGGFQVLAQPLLQRFFTKEEAVAAHQRIVEHFDEVLRIPAEKGPKKAEAGGH